MPTPGIEKKTAASVAAQAEQAPVPSPGEGAAQEDGGSAQKAIVKGRQATTRKGTAPRGAAQAASRARKTAAATSKGGEARPVPAPRGETPTEKEGPARQAKAKPQARAADNRATAAPKEAAKRKATAEKPAASPARRPGRPPKAPASAGTNGPATPPTEVAKAPLAGVADGAEPLVERDGGLPHAQLMALQQQLRQLAVPVVIVFEGWDAAGKGTLLGELLEGLDPRGYRVHTMGRPSAAESRYPGFRRYWTAMPKEGDISLFVGSWYREVSDEVLVSRKARKALDQHYQEIIQMESQLVANGTLLLKFFLDISQKEQKKRLKALESKKSTRWRVSKEDWQQNQQYEKLRHLYDEMIPRTHLDGALWHVMQGEKKGERKREMYSIVLDAFTKAVKQRQSKARPWDTPTLPHVFPMPTSTRLSLDGVQPMQEEQAGYKQAIDQAQDKLQRLQNEIYRKQIPLILGFEGWDAAGKGGSIRRLTSALDPRGFRVVPISAPTGEEKAHHHLWRFWQALPKDGHIAIFDRTWYGRVMVERIEGFCTQAQWMRGYEEINQFEWELYQHGAVLRKFWLHISKEEQLRRFEARQSTPEKQWKITEEDWRNREKWPQYYQAVNDMLQKTNTAYAPWTVVEADNKKYARLKVLYTVIEAMEEALEM